MESRKKVLVVEDETIIALDIRNKLHVLGYAVPAIASHADEAYLAASAHRPDVVLMDINLDGIKDGIEAATRISFELELPIVFLTAHDDVETLQLAQKARPLGYLTKPVKVADLVNAIQIALIQHQKQNVQRLREVRLQAHLEGVGEGLLTASPTGTIQFINREGKRLLGLLDEEVEQEFLAAILPIRHRPTGEPVRDFLRVVSLYGDALKIGEEYMIEPASKREIAGEIAISRVAGEPTGIVFTFRDWPTQSYSRNSISHGLVQADESNCSRTPINLKKLLLELEPILRAKLPKEKHLEIRSDGSVRPVLGNRQLIKKVIGGLVKKAEKDLEQKGFIRISLTNVALECDPIDGAISALVRLRVAYRRLGFTDSDELLRRRFNERGLSIDVTLAKVQSALQSLQVTAQVGSSDGWNYWTIDFPVLKNIDNRSKSPMIILIEPDAIVRTVVCKYLSSEAYECLGASDVTEALNWLQMFPNEDSVLIMDEGLHSPDVRSQLENFSILFTLLVGVEEQLGNSLSQCSAPNNIITRLFSKASLLQRLEQLFEHRASTESDNRECWLAFH